MTGVQLEASGRKGKGTKSQSQSSAPKAKKEASKNSETEPSAEPSSQVFGTLNESSLANIEKLVELLFPPESREPLPVGPRGPRP
jgi:hypothetical protein